MTSLQILFIIAAIVLLLLIILSIKRSNLSVKNSVAWFFLPIIFLIIAIFPKPIEDFAKFIGFETPSNFIFVITIAMLILLCFRLSVTISRQQSQITKLIQSISLLEEKDRHDHKK